jgi:ATP-dependent protease ClpP protease subunit
LFTFNKDNVFFLADFDDDMEGNAILPLIEQIQIQRQLKEGRIDLYINSFGGYKHLVFQMISLLELAKRDGIMVRTIVPDIAYSAGSILAITGSEGERYIERTAEHLIHYGSTGSVESTPEQLERNTRQKIENFKKILNHYKKYTDIPHDELNRLMNDDSAFITAAKCIKWNLADKYMEKFDIGYTQD